MRVLSSLFFTALACAFGSAQSAVVSHDSIPVWQQPAPTTPAQFLAVRFKPSLDVVNGCQPYPAVDAQGNTSGGLKTTGVSDGSCGDKSKAQVYARTGWYKDAFAIMYAWYMPKDSPFMFMGHRHDWENTVVWLNSDNVTTAKVIALAASGHGDYEKSYPLDGRFIADGVSARINYRSRLPINHELGFTEKTGAKQPMIQWDQLTDAARNALETTDFGDANVPFKSSFQSYLARAYFK